MSTLGADGGDSFPLPEVDLPKSRIAGQYASCDTCRIRRVRCVRPWLPDDLTCSQCKRFSIKCTNMPKKRKAAKNSSSTSAEPPTQTSESQTLATTRSSSSGGSGGEGQRTSALQKRPNVSMFSAAGRLAASEQSESLMTVLLGTYLNATTFESPILDWLDLWGKFHAAGRRVLQMDIVTRTIALGGMALGAMLTDHAAVVGANAPSLLQLRPLKKGEHLDLSRWATQRRPVCDRLINNLISDVDHSGVMRSASLESIATLTLVAGLVPFSRGALEFEIARPYWVVAVSHFRTMVEDDNRQNILNHPTGWHLALEDSFRAAHYGKAFIWTDKDIDTILPLINIDISPSVSSDQPSQTVLIEFTRHLINVLRTFARRVSIRLTKGRPVNARDLSETLEGIERVYARCNGLTSRFSKSVFVMDCQASCGYALLIFYIHFRDWCASQRSPRDAADYALVRETSQRLRRLMTATIIYFGLVVESRRDVSGIESFNFVSPLMRIRYTLNEWIGVALALPCAERGGSEEYPLAVQIRVVDVLIDALERQSWVWPERMEDVRRYRDALSNLRSRSFPSFPPPPSPPPTSPSVSTPSTSSPFAFAYPATSTPPPTNARASWTRPSPPPPHPASPSSTAGSTGEPVLTMTASEEAWIDANAATAAGTATGFEVTAMPLPSVTRGGFPASNLAFADAQAPFLSSDDWMAAAPEEFSYAHGQSSGGSGLARDGLSPRLRDEMRATMDLALQAMQQGWPALPPPAPFGAVADGHGGAGEFVGNGGVGNSIGNGHAEGLAGSGEWAGAVGSGQVERLIGNGQAGPARWQGASGAGLDDAEAGTTSSERERWPSDAAGGDGGWEGAPPTREEILHVMRQMQAQIFGHEPGEGAPSWGEGYE